MCPQTSLPRLLGMWPEMAVLYSTLSIQEKAVVPCLIYWMQIDLRCENSIEAQRNCISFLFLVFKGPIFCNSTELDSFNFVQFLFPILCFKQFFFVKFLYFTITLCCRSVTTQLTYSVYVLYAIVMSYTVFSLKKRDKFIYKPFLTAILLFDKKKIKEIYWLYICTVQY